MKRVHRLNSLIMNISCFVLATILVSCSSNPPVVSKNSGLRPQGAYGVVTNAFNRQDWDALRRLASPGMKANESIMMWENSERADQSVRVGELVAVEKDAEHDGKPCTKYSFAIESKDGEPNTHLLQILVREEGGKSTILDFWNFGW